MFFPRGLEAVYMLLTSVAMDGGARECAHGRALVAKKKHIYCL